MLKTGWFERIEFLEKDKYRFVRYLEETEGTVILPPSQHN